MREAPSLAGRSLSGSNRASAATASTRDGGGGAAGSPPLGGGADPFPLVALAVAITLGTANVTSSQYIDALTREIPSAPASDWRSPASLWIPRPLKVSSKSTSRVLGAKSCSLPVFSNGVP